MHANKSLKKIGALNFHRKLHGNLFARKNQSIFMHELKKGLSHGVVLVHGAKSTELLHTKCISNVE